MAYGFHYVGVVIGYLTTLSQVMDFILPRKIKEAVLNRVSFA
jgi:hypothetical protein